MELSTDQIFGGEAAGLSGECGPPPPSESWPFNSTAQVKDICRFLVDRASCNMPKLLHEDAASRVPKTLNNYISEFAARAIAVLSPITDRQAFPTPQENFALTTNGDVEMTDDDSVPVAEEEVSFSDAGDDPLSPLCEELSLVVIETLQEPVLETCLLYIKDTFTSIVRGVMDEYYSGCLPEEVYGLLTADWSWEDDLCTAFSYAVADNVQKGYFDATFDALTEALCVHELVSPGAVSDVLTGRVRGTVAKAIGILADGTIRVSEEAARKALNEMYHRFQYNASVSQGVDGGGEDTEGGVAWCGEQMGRLTLSKGDQGQSEEDELGWGDEDEEMGEFDELDY